MKTSTEQPWKTDSNRVMKENKAVMSINEKCQFCNQRRPKNSIIT